MNGQDKKLITWVITWEMDSSSSQQGGGHVLKSQTEGQEGSEVIPVTGGLVQMVRPERRFYSCTPD